MRHRGQVGNRGQTFFRLATLLSVCWVLVATPVLRAEEPSLSSISPQGIQRGHEVEVQYSGARLGDAIKLLFYEPGIEVKGITKVNDNAIKAQLAVAGDCRLGVHALRICTATGVSNLKAFTVGALPEVAEKEPNSEFETPQAIELNVTVSGVVQNEDIDYYQVQAKKGQRITAELEGIRLGNTFFDPYLAILNSARFELARSDDASLLRQDCVCSVTAPEDGVYIVQVRESAYGGNGACTYRLHVGTFPRPRAVMPPGGKPGETVEFHWIGDAGGPLASQAKLPETARDEYPLFAEDAAGLAPSPNRIRVNDLDWVNETEPNDSREQATPGVGPGAFHGVIGTPGDVDHFKFAAKKGQAFDVRVYARNVLRTPLDSVLVVTRSNGAGVGSNDDSGGPDSYLRFTAPADDEYILVIRDHLLAGGEHFVYRIEVTPVSPSLTMSLPERQQYVSQTLTVHRGNRMALMINASRANFGGELQLALENAPAGLKMEAPVMAANQSSIPVLFTAAADAQPDGALADLIGRPVDPNIKVEGHLSQRTMLVRGQNNRDVYGHDADRMAVSLADEVPFQIEIVQPKSPIVRNGSKMLKVVAHRREGYVEPISIVLLYNPSGIGASRSISIPGDKSEAEIPLTANGGAAIGKWPVVVIGKAKHGNASVEVATQVAELEIADAFVSFAYDKAAGELGQTADVLIKVEHKTEFEGEATVKLVGLPANTSLEKDTLTMTKETETLVFPVKVDASARPGTYKSLVCQVVIQQNGEPVPHTLGTGELRVDKPLPPKVEAPKPAAKPMPAPMPMPEAKKPEKRLSRLEQLRLDREKAKAERE